MFVGFLYHGFSYPLLYIFLVALLWLFTVFSGIQVCRKTSSMCVIYIYIYVTEIRWNHWCSYVYFHCVHYTKIWFAEHSSCSKTAKISSCPKLFVDYIAVHLLTYWVHQYFKQQVGKWLFEALLLSTMYIVCIMLNRWCCMYSIHCCRWSLMTDVTCQKWR